MSVTHDPTNRILEMAHDYRNRGWSVIPLHRVGPDGVTCSCAKGARCPSAGKHPKAERWQETERMSAADIQATWDTERTPNLGIVTGPASGIWVLDIDPKANGLETMSGLVAEHGRLPETFCVQTGSGGYHYYFTLPESCVMRNTSGKVGPGIDTRGEGGQVVAAPSRSSVGPYVVVKNVAPAPAPEWLIEAASASEQVNPVVTADDLPKPTDLSEEEWTRLNAYATRAVELLLARLDKMRLMATPDGAGYQGEPWNHTTFEVACSLTEIANSPWCAYGHDRAAADLMAHAPRDVEFDDWVVKRTLQSARDRIGDKARPVPEDRRKDDDGGSALFRGPDVRGASPGPSGGDGTTTGSPVTQVSPEVFFDKTALQAAILAHAVQAQGPVAWGADEAFWRWENGVWVSDPKVIESRCVALLGDKFRNEHTKTVATVVKHTATFLDGRPRERWINFQDTMLDWRTGETFDHDPSYGSTVQMGTVYDPTATCLRFDAFLEDVLHPDYIALAWEMLGYLMYSGNRLQVAFLMYGSGGNGKGTLMRVIQALLGHQNVANESLDDLNNNRFSAVNLFGKIANLAGDIDGTYQEHTANFKKLTGEDTYAGERKFGDRFTFESWAVPVFSANKIPGSADVTEGYLRRWVVLHFHKHITNVIGNLSEDLIAELPGIAYKATQALRVLMARGKFAPEGKAVEGKETFARLIDQVRQWTVSGVPILDEGTVMPLQDLYSSYSVWAERTGQRRVKELEFSHRLEAAGFPATTANGVPSHVGLRVQVFAGHGAHAGLGGLA